MDELGIGEHLRQGAGHYKETRDRGRYVTYAHCISECCISDLLRENGRR